MSFATETAKTSFQDELLIVFIIKESLTLTGWEYVSSPDAFTKLYKIAFSRGAVRKISEGTSLWDRKDSTADIYTNRQFWFDDSENILYGSFFHTTDPDTVTVTYGYEVYGATRDQIFHRTPTDSTTRQVFWPGIVTSAPSIRQELSDIFFGVLPSGSATIALENTNQTFSEVIDSGSLYNSDLEIYEVAGELSTANAKLVMTATIRDIAIEDSTLTLRVIDRFSKLDNLFLPTAKSGSYWTTANFAGLDPSFENAPIRLIYGYVEGHKAINLDYVEESPTTSDNRQWGIGFFGDSIDATVPASPSSTTTRTYLDSALGWQVGDTVDINSQYTKVTAVNTSGSHYIDHDAVVTPASASDTITLEPVSRVEIIRDGVTYLCYVGRDYQIVGSSISFTSSVESNVSLPSNIQAQEIVRCRVRGADVTVLTNETSGGSTVILGSSTHFDTAYGCTTNPGLLIGFILRRAENLNAVLAYIEEILDEDNFTAYCNAATEKLGFVIPQSANGSWPTCRQILSEIARTTLTQITINSSGQYTLRRVEPLPVSTDYTITDDEIEADSFTQTVDYNDIKSIVTVGYGYHELSLPTGQIASTRRVQEQSNDTTELHDADRELGFTSQLFREADATALCQNMLYALGARRGKVTLQAGPRFFNVQIGDSVTVQRQRLLGYPYVEGTLRSSDYRVIGYSRQFRDFKITLILDDQKGIEDNSGSWNTLG